MTALENSIQSELLSLRDAQYQAFQARLLPNLAPETIIGVRTPQLRALAKRRRTEPEIMDYLGILPHRYFEENQLHAFLIETVRDFDAAIALTERFLPYVDNWATCDCFRPKVFAKHPDALLAHIRDWAASDRTYTVRYAVGLLLSNYLDAQFDPAQLAMAAQIHSDEYYVNMMVAWYFATALTKQETAALPYFEQPLLPDWTRKKAIQKALESYRISPERKAWLRALRQRLH